MITPDELRAWLSAAPEHGEQVEVFLKTSHQRTIHQGEGGLHKTTHSHHREIEVRSWKGPTCGACRLDSTDLPTLTEGLALARSLRQPAPALWQSPAHRAPLHSDDTLSWNDGEIPSQLELDITLRRASPRDSNAGISAVIRRFLLADTCGTFASYHQRECQLLATASGRRFATGGTTPADLTDPTWQDPTSIPEPLSPWIDPRQPATILVTAPAATAQLIHRCTAPWRQPTSPLPSGTLINPQGLTIIDDPETPDTPGYAPWDDEGTPRRRQALLLDGETQQPLPQAGCVQRDGFRGGFLTTSRLTMNLPNPTQPAPGGLLLIDKIIGRPPRLTTLDTPIPLSFTGTQWANNTLTPVRGTANASARQLLASITQLLGPRFDLRAEALVHSPYTRFEHFPSLQWRATTATHHP